MDQLNIFDYIREPFEVKNKIRLIEVLLLSMLLDNTNFLV